MSKQEDIISYIKSVEPGNKISVRFIAGEMDVSEGTAYKAIKECESLGLVSTIPRVGTIRVEKPDKKSFKNLTFSDVLEITNGTILGGKHGLSKTLNRFAIGAMTVEAFEKYVSPNSLVIVGNREEIQKCSLEQNAAVLISGGFGCSMEVKRLADEKELPIISCDNDTFSIATMINKAISENKIRREIILVRDIMREKPSYLNVDDTIERWNELLSETTHIRYPVVDKDMKVVGIVTPKDLPRNSNNDESIKSIMIKDPITVTPKTTVAYAAHIMGCEDIELCPVVDGRKLIGVITRKDVIKAYEYMNTHSDYCECLEDTLLKNFKCRNENNYRIYEGNIPAKILNNVGTASWSALNMLLTATAIDTLKHNNLSVSVDNISTYFMKPVQVDSKITIEVEILDMGRVFSKVSCNILNNKKELIGKGLLSAIRITE